MKYSQRIILKNGKECCLRNGTESDGQAVLDNFNLTHEETDYLLFYPDENSFDLEKESRFLTSGSRLPTNSRTTSSDSKTMHRRF